ncbi:hypothetical protein [Burkholderia lata]|uniref:hypothetical protein n=1 Tax=Burkholderia lata (strain ATCC 17760 / DSM 23089 / LMG 22485 / NCIMB 9086 / R18194 / 383) TaxID=482957 RepID=UPI0012FD5FE9|nr:hypothetical protein [Burkholderia lata]
MIYRPQTLFVDLSKEMSATFERGHLIPKDSELALSLGDRIDKLSEAMATDAAKLRGFLHVMCGDLDGAIAVLAGSGLAPSRRDFEIFAALTNLGYASRGLELYSVVGSPTTGSFTKCLPGGIALGAFRAIGRFLTQAETMHLSNMDGVPVEMLRTAERILENAGTDDAAVARVLDVAGHVVREYGLVHTGTVQLDAFDSTDCVKLRYRFAISPDQAAWLYNEFLDRLFDENVPVPSAFVVSFEGQNITH